MMTVSKQATVEMRTGEGREWYANVATALKADPVLAVGALVIILWCFIALTVPLWSPYDPVTYQDLNNKLAPPTKGHLFGTDSLGRDVFSRVMYGSRISLPLSIIVIASGCLIGSAVGSAAGYLGGPLDELLMRICDATLAFPSIVLALAIGAALGPSLQNVMIAVIAVWWPEYARLLRGQVLSVKNYEHVLSAECVGCSDMQILVRHILPLCLSPVLVKATLDMGGVILVAAGLSFIGLGAVPPTPEWGVMINEGRLHFYQWWLATFPGLAILTVVLGFNFIGDSLRDLLDPATRRKIGA
jgi:peptide/nickel transport system permease protein